MPPSRQDAAHQVAPPVVAVLAVRRALGVDLADRCIAVEQPGVQEVHEGQDVAAAVGEAEAARLGKVVVIRVISSSVSAPRSVIETSKSASSAAATVSAISSQRS